MNLFLYTEGNPVNRVDPKGLWIKSFHLSMTYVSMLSSDCPKVAREMANLTAGVDTMPGSQNPENSYLHAMSNGNDPFSLSKDINNYMILQNKGSNSYNIDDIKLALHSLQDSFAKAHSGFQPWNGRKVDCIYHWSDAI